ncbi:MAG TPA: hypothetical protein VFN20_05525, partial [Candidatus Acidoferrum sp.]|nr:hypothetical protein [Candidatus Acidoferrum sp.]
MVHRAKSGNVALPFRAAFSRKGWSAIILTALLAGTAAVYATPRANHRANDQEKEAAREAQTDHATSLSDQTDLAVTVYNSNIALIRDVRNL